MKMDRSSPYPDGSVTSLQEQDFPPVLKIGHSDPYFSEQFKGLRAKLESQFDANGIKVVAITSAIAGEGKTLSAANLAINFALAGRKKVLLIDSDLRKSDLARGLHISSVPGLVEYLMGTATLNDIVQSTFIPGMYIIPAGKTMPDPSTMLAGEKFRSLVGKFRDTFDVVLLDTPPIIPVADTLSLRDLVDGFLFLFRVQVTPYPMLKQALEELGNSNILGVVLNGLEPHKYKYYKRYYGKYYHKSTEEDTPS
jgi:capsular exopolysaccharide synthesis family protein